MEHLIANINALKPGEHGWCIRKVPEDRLTKDIFLGKPIVIKGRHWDVYETSVMWDSLGENVITLKLLGIISDRSDLEEYFYKGRKHFTYDHFGFSYLTVYVYFHHTPVHMQKGKEIITYSDRGLHTWRLDERGDLYKNDKMWRTKSANQGDPKWRGVLVVA